MGDVTVVIPFWNLDLAVLRACVDSVRAQSEPCEILVVDNKSDVPIPAMDGVQVLRLTERVSIGKARTLGLQSVSTRYLMFMDADDVLLPGAIRHLHRLIESKKGVGIAAGGIVDWITETNYRRYKPWPSKLEHWISRMPRLFRFCNAIRNMTPVTGCALVDTEMAKRTLGFPDTTAEEWAFSTSMSFRGSLLLSREPVKLYRWRADGLSKQAIRDWKALYDARRSTRNVIRTDELAPRWMKRMLPLFLLLHMLELPFHVRRETAFNNVGKNVPVPERAERADRDVAAVPSVVPSTVVARFRPVRNALLEVPASQGSAALAQVIGVTPPATADSQFKLKKRLI